MQSYDDYYNAVGCAAYSDGGCPCPEGEEKCGGTSWWPGTCTTLCCEEDEDTCYDENYSPTECKAIADGGCDCPEGEVKCYAEPEWNMPGICVDACCTDEQEICYDYDTGLNTCADIAAGGCPCPEGEEKCGAYEGFAGYCTSLCCEEDEYTCFDMSTYEPTSCVAWDEDCPTGISFDTLKGKSMTMIDQSAMKHQITAKLQKVKAMKAKMLANENANDKSVEKIVKAAELTILREVKRGVSRKSANKNAHVFMTKVY